MKQPVKKKVFAICGSTRQCSANLQLLKNIASLTAGEWEVDIFTDLALLPHFNPDLDKEGENPPGAIPSLRQKIAMSDGVLICTPEYVFSLPGSLKNLLEWMVSTTVFSEKPVAIITASAHGEKGHEALRLIMKTIYADLREGAQLLISGVRAKIGPSGQITDRPTKEQILSLVSCFSAQMGEERSKP
ncbi:MAG: NADPH-dependent FMN reductase [Flavisolibacter sp.]